jgi:L-fuculose-phosphate aldolase
MVLLAGGDVRCAEHATFGTEALARHVVAALADRRAVLLANHGAVAIGATLGAAVTLAVEVENLAGQYLDLLAAGLAPVLLTPRDLAEAAAQFAGYGRAT